ncbi:MAG: class I SAM-dependent methyltransferase [Chromatocurvus sp.]
MTAKVLQSQDSAAAGVCRTALLRPPPGPECHEVDWEQLARSLDIPLLEPAVSARHDTRCDVYLSQDETGPFLQLTGTNAPGPVRCAFYDPAMTYRRRGGQNELLGRAVGIHRRPASRVVDATGGLAADAFVLADLGARVLLCEQHPLLATLLTLSVNHLQAAQEGWRAEVACRLSVRSGDSRSLPAAQLHADDVLYLDPMFPSGRRSAAGKGMALLQRLLSEDPDDAAETLLRWALRQRVRRVVVKRPLKAPQLCNIRPSHALPGRSVRFDVYQLDGAGIDES